MTAFATALIAIAISPVIAGAVIDAPLAWHAYRKIGPKPHLTRIERIAVVKFGDIDTVVAG